MINVKDHGARGNGIDLDTTAILDIIANLPVGGEQLYFPSGIYPVDQPLNFINKSGVSIVGDGFSTILYQKNPTLDLLNISGTSSGFILRDIWVGGQLDASAGSVVNVTSTGNPAFIADNIIVSGGYNNVRFAGGFSSYISHFTFTQPTNTYFVFDNPTMGVCLSDGQFSGDNGNTGAAIEWIGGNGLEINHVDIFRTNIGIKMVPPAGVVSGHGRFQSVTVEETSLNKPAWWVGGSGGSLYQVHLTDCWGAAAPGPDGHGMIIAPGIVDINLNNFSGIGNGGHGFIAFTGGFNINGGQFNGNAGNGISLFPSISDFKIRGMIAKSNRNYGIYLYPGASNKYVISENLVSGNDIGGLFDGGMGSQKAVLNNL